MSNLLKSFDHNQIKKLTKKKSIPTFRSGDTIKVTIKITEGSKSRLQSFEGLCIARKNNSINSNFTLRKISHGEGVERVFPLFSPLIEKIDVVRKGDVKRAKLYYLRNLTGKKARIADRDRGDEADQYEYIEETQTEEETKNVGSNVEAPETSKAEDVDAKQEETKVDAESNPEEESKAEAKEESSKEEDKTAENKSDDKK